MDEFHKITGGKITQQFFVRILCEFMFTSDLVVVFSIPSVFSTFVWAKERKADFSKRNIDSF